MIMTVTFDMPAQEEPKTPFHSRTTWLMQAGFLIYTLLILLGHLVSFSLGYAYLHTVCSSGCSLTPENVRALEQVGLSITFYANLYITIQVLYILVCVGFALLIVFKKPGQWIPLGLSCWLLWFSAYEGVDYLSLIAAYPALNVPVQLLLELGGGVLGSYAVLTFPNGKFGSRWILGYFLASIVEEVLSIFIVTPAFVIINGVFTLASFPILLVVLIYRACRLLNTKERAATKWLIVGWSIFILTFVPVFFVLPSVVPADSPALLIVNFAGFFGCGVNIVGCLMAVLYANIFDIDIFVRRTLVYTLLTAILTMLYVGMVVGTQWVLTTFSTQVTQFPLILVASTLVIAGLFRPLRARLQRIISRLMYGERDDPSTVLSRLGHRLEATLAPEMVLPAIVETIATALKLPYVAITLKQGDVFISAVSSGSSQNEVLVLPLLYQNEIIAQLLIAPRAPHETFTSADLRLLEAIASQAGVAAHAVRLTADLQRSRERLVTTREEERRRLRRDLHDGLGPTLASMTLKMDAARNILIQNPPAVDPLLVELRTRMQATIVDIRRLVYDLRPPVLDELGLVSALSEHVVQYSHPGGVQVVIEAPADLPPLPAAVEVAVYRVVLEAVTNVVRHAQARTCCVRLQLSDALMVEVNDDGQGLPHHFQAGVGISSMRERAAELGGTCVIESNGTGGTHILFRFPLAKE
jgi:signal transduction histidine kinase